MRLYHPDLEVEIEISEQQAPVHRKAGWLPLAETPAASGPNPTPAAPDQQEA